MTQSDHQQLQQQQPDTQQLDKEQPNTQHQQPAVTTLSQNNSLDDDETTDEQPQLSNNANNDLYPLGWTLLPKTDCTSVPSVAAPVPDLRIINVRVALLYHPGRAGSLVPGAAIKRRKLPSLLEKIASRNKLQMPF
jgi:hypothetical protein